MISEAELREDIFSSDYYFIIFPDVGFLAFYAYSYWYCHGYDDSLFLASSKWKLLEFRWLYDSLMNLIICSLRSGF